MLTYPAGIPLSTRSLTHLSELIRTHRAERGTRWRRLDPGKQSLLVLAHLTLAIRAPPEANRTA